jgi:hypothetical protein
MSSAVETIMPGTHINISDDAHVAFWCEKFDVDPNTLFSAVRAVGGSARFVHRYIEGVRYRDA